MGIFSKSWNCLQELRDMICCAYRWNAMIFGRFNFEYFIYGAFLKGSLVNIMNESWTINTVTHNPYTTYRNKRRQSKCTTMLKSMHKTCLHRNTSWKNRLHCEYFTIIHIVKGNKVIKTYLMHKTTYITRENKIKNSLILNRK